MSQEHFTGLHVDSLRLRKESSPAQGKPESDPCTMSPEDAPNCLQQSQVINVGLHALTHCLINKCPMNKML